MSDYGYNWENTSQFFDLKGMTIKNIVLDDTTLIETTDGQRFQLVHHQDCCENVGLHTTFGKIEDVIGSPITLAEDDHPGDPEWFISPEYRYESHTWSRFILETEKGRLEVWFLGSSNGYYGESVSFEKIVSRD
jgi:hypothetical protein